MALIPKWEIHSATAATLIGFMFFCGLNMFVAQRIFQVKLEYQRLAVILSLAALASLFGQSLNVGVVPFLVKAILLLLIPALLWWFSIVTQDVKSYLRNVVCGTVLRFRGSTNLVR